MFIGDQLLKIRTRKGLSQQEVADELKVSQSTYWSWENNRSNFDMEMLTPLAKILDVPETELLPQGSVVKIVNFNENNDSSVNGFEVNVMDKDIKNKLITLMDTQTRLIESLTSQVYLLTQEISLLRNSKKEIGK